MKVCYVAGPFRGANAWEIEGNIRRAEEVALRVWQAGFVAICPHTNTRYFQGVAPDEVWMNGSLEILKRCDAVVTVEGWERSEGATAEIDLARSLGIPVFHSIDAPSEA